MFHRRYSDEKLWATETILFSGKEFRDALLARVRGAKQSIRIESYIFERDAFGEELLGELRRAARRGLKVRLLVDAIGSPAWNDALLADLAKDGIRAQIFGTPRSLFASFFRLMVRGHWITAYRVIRKLQLRDHRKLAIFDESEAIVGSANVGLRFDEWRENAVILSGLGVLRLKASFVRSWHFARGERASIEPWERTPRVRTNFFRRERWSSNHRYLGDLASARTRIWMTTAYFNPGPRLLRALTKAKKRGVDVRIVVPHHSDISFFPWISRAIFAGLIARDIMIFEFKGVMVHAKTTLFDDRAIIGSTNLNHRSFMHDLELDVVIETPSAIESLEQVFLADSSQSVPMTRDAIRRYAKFAYFTSLLFSPVKRWL